jgi:hypothetical protein
MALSMDSKLKDLLADPDAKAIIDEIIPQLSGHPSMNMVAGMKMRKIVKIPYSNVNKEQAKELEDRINALNK